MIILRTSTRRARALLVLALAGMLSPNATADGIAFKGGDWSSLYPAAENEQIAAIHHRDGVQKMIIAINFDAEDDEHGLWMFPVPSKPEAVEINIQPEFPAFRGHDPRVRARRAIVEAGTILRAWEILPLLAEVFPVFSTLHGSAGIDIHAEVERWGIRAEAIQATLTETLGEHLASKGVAIEAAQLATIVPYLDGEHALVLAWITSIAEVRQAFPDAGTHSSLRKGRTPSLYVEFPTERAYFPLEPTSAYGDVKIPLRLYVTGFVEPQTSATAVSAALHVEHFRLDKSFRKPELTTWSESLPLERVAYTLIIGAPLATTLTDDLWFDAVQPPGMAYADTVLTTSQRNLGLVLFVLFLVGLSYVSGGVTGMLVLRKWSTPAKLGCWNVLTWVGLRLALRHHNITGDVGGTETKMRDHFTCVFMLVFVALSVVLQVILSAPLWWIAT